MPRYKYDKEKQKVVEVKDAKATCKEYIGRVDEPYYDVGLDTVVRSVNHKRRLLKERGLHIR